MPHNFRSMTSHAKLPDIWATAFLLAMTLVACNRGNGKGASDSTALGLKPPDNPLVQIRDVQIGKSIDAKKTIPDQSATFGAHDTIYVVAITYGVPNAPVAKVGTKWTFNEKTVVKELNKTISPSSGTVATVFHIDNHSGWPLGRYKVEVMLNGFQAGYEDFEIRSP